VNLPADLVRQIDELVGPRKRSEFIERAVLRQLRLEALDRLKALSEKFRGLPLLIFEVANALWKAVRVARIDFVDAVEAVRKMEELRIPLRTISLADTLTLAHRYERTAYDAAYLTLASLEEVPLITADKRLYNALKDKFEWIMWIESA